MTRLILHKFATKMARRTRVLPAFFACALLSCAVGPDPEEPAITILQPLGTASVQGSVTFQVQTRGSFEGNASLWVGETMLHQWEPAGTLSLAVDTTSLPDDFYVFEARATLDDGETLMDSVALTVDNSGPSLELVEPILPDIYLEDGPFPFVVEASDIVGIDRVSLYIDDVLLNEWVSPTGTTLTTNFDPGTLLGSTEFFARVEAIDREGRRSETGRRFGLLRRELFTVFLDPAKTSPVILADNTIVVGTDDRLTILEAAGTERCNIASTGGATERVLVVPESDVIYWSTLSELQVISLTDCTSIFAMAARGVTGIAHLSGNVSTVTFEGMFRTHRTTDGTVLAELDLNTVEGVTPPVEMHTNGLAYAPDGTLYIAGSAGTSGVLYIRDPMGVIAAYNITAPIQGGIAVDAEGVFMPGTDGSLYRFGPSGTMLWRRPTVLSLAAAVFGTPVIGRDEMGQDQVVVSDGLAGVHGVDVETGELLWSHMVDPTNALGTISRGGVGSDGTKRYYTTGDALGGVTVLERDGSLRFRSLVGLGGMVTAVPAPPAVGIDRVAAIDATGLLVVYQL